MKHSFHAVGAVLFIMLLPLLLMFGASHAEPQVPVETPTTTVTRTDNSGPGSVNSGRRVHIPTPTVRVTIKIPGPTDTVTIRLPGDTRTVTQRVPVPGPTRTVTAPGGTETRFVTLPPRTVTANPTLPTVTETRTIVSEPTETVTVGGSPNATPRQDVTNGGTIDDKDEPAVDIGDGEATPEEVGLGLATLVALLAAGVGLLWAGYTLGHKDAESNEKDFTRALLDTAKRRH